LTTPDPSKVEHFAKARCNRPLAIKLYVTDAARVAETLKGAMTISGETDKLVNNPGVGQSFAAEAGQAAQ